MNSFRRIFDFYLKNSLHVGFAVYCLFKITEVSNGLTIDNNLPICIFLGTVLTYNFLKYFKLFLNKRLKGNTYYSIVFVTFIAGIGFSIYFFSLNSNTQKWLLLAGLFCFIYPFLRNYGWAKILIVSFVVSFVTVYIPFQNNNKSGFFILEFVQRTFILISLLVPFEILDSKTDNQSLKTLPQLFGINTTKGIGILFVFMGMGLEFLKLNFQPILFVIGMITSILIYFTHTKRNRYYTSFWVESVPILWWVLVLLYLK